MAFDAPDVKPSEAPAWARGPDMFSSDWVCGRLGDDRLGGVLRAEASVPGGPEDPFPAGPRQRPVLVEGDLLTALVLGQRSPLAVRQLKGATHLSAHPQAHPPAIGQQADVVQARALEDLDRLRLPSAA